MSFPSLILLIKYSSDFDDGIVEFMFKITFVFYLQIKPMLTKTRKYAAILGYMYMLNHSILKALLLNTILSIRLNLYECKT